MCLCVCVCGLERGSAACTQRVACTAADYYEYQSKCDRYNKVVFSFHFHLFSFSCLADTSPETYQTRLYLLTDVLFLLNTADKRTFTLTLIQPASTWTHWPRPQTHFWCIQSPGNVSGGCKCRPISLKRNLKIEANEVVSACIVRYHAVAD